MIIYIPKNKKSLIKGTPVAKVDSKNFLREYEKVQRIHGNLHEYVYCDWQIYKVTKQVYINLGGRVII